MAEEKVIETKVKEVDVNIDEIFNGVVTSCLLYTSDAADE